MKGERIIPQKIMKTKEAKKEKKGRKGKTALKVLGIILAVIILAVGVLTVVNIVGNKANMEKALSFDTVTYENQLAPTLDEDGNWTFVTDGEFKVMQLTDVHIGGGFLSFKKDSMALNSVAAMITAEKPDLVIVTGDVAYPVPFQAGTFNNKKSAEIFSALMNKLGVYWTLTFGNHDTELYSYYDREEMGDFYENLDCEKCLYKKGPEEISGVGNQIINVKNSQGVFTQTLYVFDSHSYTDGDFLGIMWKYDNIHPDQTEWYKTNVEKYNALNAEKFKELKIKGDSTVKSSMFFHIPLTEFKDAWYEYANNGFADTENVKLVYGTAGEENKVVYCGVGEDDMFETITDLGSTKAVFCGHDHKNNFSLDYKGIRLTYGMSIDYLAYPGIYKLGSQRGCTMITYKPDGSFNCKAENYYQDKYTSLYEKEPVELQNVVPVEVTTEK